MYTVHVATTKEDLDHEYPTLYLAMREARIAQHASEVLAVSVCSKSGYEVHHWMCERIQALM
jgi:hypothetical protein